MSARHYRHPRIFTGAGEDAYATAFAVENGLFTWVGHAADIPAGAHVTDLDGELVVPGLIDTHMHPTMVAVTLGAVACTVPAVNSIAEMVAALRRHPNAGKGPDAWIRGWGYDESKLAEHRTPTRHDLDRVSETQPVFVMRSDAHSAVCNTRALEIAGVGPHTPDPEGAHYGREADGCTPSGILLEMAASRHVEGFIASGGFDEEVDRLVAVGRHLARHGITAVTDMLCIPVDHPQLDLYRAAAARGFRQWARVYYHYEAIADGGAIPALTPADLAGRQAIGGIKLLIDGSISNRTAWMKDPYPDSHDHGMRTTSPAMLERALAFAREHQLQLAVHGMGDRGIEAVVERFEREDPWLDGIPSVRIEHAAVMSLDLIERILDANMTFGVVGNPNFFYAEFDSYAENLTDDQFRRTYMMRSLYHRVPALALASDAPATTWADPCDPFVSIQAAVTRAAYNGADMVPEQALTPAQALLLHTGRARLTADFGKRGMIAPGFAADFAALSRDILRGDPRLIVGTEAVGTWIAGEPVPL